MSVTPEEVGRIAALARLVLPDDEARRLTRDLNAILDHVAALPAAAGPGDPHVPVGPASAPERRQGEIRPDPLREGPEAFAPDWRDGLFVVPRLPALEREFEGEGQGT